MEWLPYTLTAGAAVVAAAIGWLARDQISRRAHESSRYELALKHIDSLRQEVTDRREENADLREIIDEQDKTIEEQGRILSSVQTGMLRTAQQQVQMINSVAEAREDIQRVRAEALIKEAELRELERQCQENLDKTNQELADLKAELKLSVLEVGKVAVSNHKTVKQLEDKVSEVERKVGGRRASDGTNDPS